MPLVTTYLLIRLTPLRPSALAVPVTDLPAAVTQRQVRVYVPMETQRVTIASNASKATMVTQPAVTLADPVRVLSRLTATRK